MRSTRLGKSLSVLIFALALFTCGRLLAGVTASISGTVTDPSGAVVAGATVTATNVETGVATTLTTNTQGFYSFQSLPLGNYTISVQQSGFKGYSQTGLVLDVNSALVIDVHLEVGATTEKVEVSSDALHVDTESTQMGEVITGKTMTDVPLVSRSYTDLLGLQPGVAQTASQMTGAYAGPFISAGFAVPQVSGDLNSGAVSVNGMRESENGFILNGILVQELGFSGAGAIPNLDSIYEFRILTNNPDAEYGNYSGGLINVVTKSGTNGFHGNLFEFVRNTDFDAANYFAFKDNAVRITKTSLAAHLAARSSATRFFSSLITRATALDPRTDPNESPGLRRRHWKAAISRGGGQHGGFQRQSNHGAERNGSGQRGRRN